MKCPSCGFDNPTGFAFCGKCGNPLAPACPQCGFENPPGFTFCGKCGAPLQDDQPEHLSPAELDHLRAYLPAQLIETLQLERVSPALALLARCVDHLTELLRTARTLLPPYLVEQVVQDPTPGKIGGQFVEGTLLFADISGFTSMSERLSRIGREGAEEITSIVNRYFSTMLSLLSAHGGQLVKFGGDALLGLFFEPDSATRAVQAAHHMQGAMDGMRQVQTSQGDFPLQMKVGLHRGRFLAARLGTAQGMEYALFGGDVNATAATESAAQAGQILLDRATLEAIRTPCQTEASGPDAPYVALSDVEQPLDSDPALHVQSPSLSSEPSLANLRRLVELLDALSPYLPAGLMARLSDDPHAASVEGEHRLVGVLFANVEGLGEVTDRLGPGKEDEIVAALNQYFTTMEEGIQRFGGVINKMDLYEHGDKLLAFFGAPVAHEDDAERAVRAALAMQQSMLELSQSLPEQIGLPDLRLSQKIGISFGYVFAGYVGTDWRHEYTVMGDEVNLAARLMSTAGPGAIIVSGDVRRKVRALFDLDAQGEVQVKGKRAPIPIFSVVAPRAAPEPVRGLAGMRSPLVGRQAEWEQMQVAVAHLSRGRGQIVSVTGEAGLGKSRLVAEMRQQTADSPVKWIEGRCLSYTESVSYHPFHEIVQALIGVQPDDSEAEAWNKLRALLETASHTEELEAALPYLANFISLQLEETLQEKTRYLDAEALQRRTFLAIDALIESQASLESPLALVLEDIHWIDQASMALLEHLMSLVNHVPLMLALVYRPERAKRCWEIHEKITREFPHCAVKIALSRLAPADGQQLLTNLVGIEQWPDAIRALIFSRTEGNPLYIEEVIRALIDDGVLVQDESGAWQVRSDLETINVPDTLQGVLMARLDRLEEPCRWTAQLASVVGRVFPFDVLSHVLPENGAKLSRNLVRLQRHETVRETQRVPELIYTFKHAMMQEVCYHSLLARVRRQYHRKIAEYLETDRLSGRRDAESNIPVVAHHAFVGQDWARALRYQLLAGRQAQKLFANHEAIDHFEKALQSAEHLPPEETLEERQNIHASLGELLTTTSQYEHALEHLDQALDLSTERDDRDAQAFVCHQLARLYELRGEYPPAFEWIECGLTALENRKTAEAAELLLRAGFINTRQGDYDQALDQCQQGLDIAKELGELATLARAYNLMGHIFRLRGKSVQAIEYFQQAFQLQQRAGDIHGQATMHNQIANAYFDMGQWQEAEDNYRQARQMFDQVGDIYNLTVANNNLGGIARNQGRLDDALALYQEALESLGRIGGSLFVLGALHMNLGATFVRKGDTEAARQHLKSSQSYYGQAQARDFLPELHRHLAEAALLVGDLEETQRQAEQSLKLSRELEMRAEEGCALRTLGKLAVARGQIEEALQALGERPGGSVAILDEVGDEYEKARSQLCLARVYASAGQPAAAQATLDDCEGVFERLDAALDRQVARALRDEMAQAS
ncbi:MAG TPA: tetratricopeptide repeat protein [Chloroflexi bacterium]|nr:tetratricopeptide repeat protein [Chloroflexota bacterium]